MFTIDDHRRQPLRYPICGQGHVWKQRGNRTGHCSSCHSTFEGISLFTAHQRQGDQGQTICLDPTQFKIAGHWLEEREGSWRGPAMPKGVFGASEDEE